MDFNNYDEYDPLPSLWQFIESSSPISELSEIRSVLGASLIEENVDLRLEVDTLFKILLEVKGNCQSCTTLPEPPEIRHRLKQEIKFFTDILESKTENGSNPKARNSVIEYALTARENSDSCLSSGRGSPTLPMLSARQPPGWREAEGVRVDNIDELVQQLQKEIRDENTLLKEDCDRLQDALNNGGVLAPKVPVPTLAELKTERTKLEKEYLSTSNNGRDKLSTGDIASQPAPETSYPLASLTVKGSSHLSNYSNVVDIPKKQSVPLKSNIANDDSKKNPVSPKCDVSTNLIAKWPPVKGDHKLSTVKSKPSINGTTVCQPSSPHKDHQYPVLLPKLNLHTMREQSSTLSADSDYNSERSTERISSALSRPETGASQISINSIDINLPADPVSSARRPTTADKLRKLVVDNRSVNS